MDTPLLAFLLGAGFTAVVAVAIAFEAIVRLVPRLELHSVSSVLQLLRFEVLRRHRPGAVPLQRRLGRVACRQRLVLGAGRTYAAESIVLWVSEADHRMLAAIAPMPLLQEALGTRYQERARQQGWIGGDTVSISIHGKPALSSGTIDVQFRVGDAPFAAVPFVAADAPVGRAVRTRDEGSALESTQPYDSATAYHSYDSEHGDLTRTERFEPEACSATVRYRDAVTALFADEAPVRLGRSSSADIRLEEAGVSRLHATLHHQGGMWTLEPLPGTTNGTFVDGVRVEASRTLRGRCIIRLGRAGALEFSTDCRHAEAR